MDNRTYIVDTKDLSETRYYFDVNTDTSKNSSSEVADSPIDASYGSTLQDKRIINMKTVGISGKFSARYTNNSSFKVDENRIGTIVAYFEDALAKQKIYTVYRKGAVYPNMMLNKVTFKFGEYCSTVDVSLSFIEVVIISQEISDTYKVITTPTGLETFLGDDLISIPKYDGKGNLIGYNYEKHVQLQSPELYLACKLIRNPNSNYQKVRYEIYVGVYLGEENRSKLAYSSKLGMTPKVKISCNTTSGSVSQYYNFSYVTADYNEPSVKMYALVSANDSYEITGDITVDLYFDNTERRLSRIEVEIDGETKYVTVVATVPKNTIGIIKKEDIEEV